jgi:hypothetical protein
MSIKNRHFDISRRFTNWFARRRFSRIAFIVSALSAFSLAAAPATNTVKIGPYGKLQGALNGYAWVAPSQQATVASPNPCNNSGCFRNTGEQLCTKGHINALSCTGQGTPQVSCNWAQNWGVVLGLNTTEPQGPWGAAAPTRVAVNYTSVARGGSAGHYRLNAHVAGDPYTKQYCVDNYTPGAVVQAGDFKSECWFNTGDTLPNFRAVDQLGLLRASEFTAVDFDFCVTQITTE